MEWDHVTSPKEKDARMIPSAVKVMVTVFWGSLGCILVHFSTREDQKKTGKLETV